MTIKYIEKAKQGRPAITFDLEELEQLARRGLSYEQIAQSLSVNFKTLASHRKKNPDIQNAIDKGRAVGVATVSNALYESAVSGNLGAQVFFLKNRDAERWRDKFYNSVDVDLGSLHLEAMKKIISTDDTIIE